MFRMRETISVIDSSSGRVIQLSPALKTQDLVSGCLVSVPPVCSAVSWPCTMHRFIVRLW